MSLLLSTIVFCRSINRNVWLSSGEYALDGTVKVEYHWKHENHNPTETSDAVRSKFPPTTLQWIQNHVDDHLDCEKSSRTFAIDGEGTSSRYQTLYHVMDSTFVQSWISPLQAKLLQESNEIYIGATHKTCKSIINCPDDAYFFSIIAKNAVTGHGYPPAFIITDKEDSENLQLWLR
ncbi:hypothetical protein BJV82DRAFT_575202 [Fennellomyces sp. T-0311]|nr:hypothetical protein BJV82DRAFT_575202 [Fennellomyces sp. T-0311]